MPEINWYPGHMAKTRRMLIEQLKSIDAVIELCDARAPHATRNPDLNALCRGKARILVLNKADLANDQVTKLWLDHYKKQNLTAIRFNANGGKTREIMAAIEQATKPVVEKMKAKGVMKTVRLMVIGIPNVGKSTFINRIFGSAIAKSSDRPGVTRTKQWVKVGPYLELMDTPGMLWPKLGDQGNARTLAYLGSVRDQILDTEGLANDLIGRLMEIAPEAARARFKLPETLEEDDCWLYAACRGRGWILSGGRLDTDRGAALILDEFRGGKVGRITLDKPVAPIHPDDYRPAPRNTPKAEPAREPEQESEIVDLDDDMQ